MRNIRIGVTGVGKIGKTHLELYSKIEGAEIVAICDVNEQEAKKVENHRNIQVYSRNDIKIGRDHH
ncbi:Gfo/Idh/MocA family oxidoreductase [Bacillus niameyensis]|uniref:Gfo/Idh/MocA family oxidoreductase n=1 Tax=Bacillus niameyensis TaxID=1522308 RepID=UPI000781EAC5|nr:Gfo/Idh/MocA family oxidoreductase [Bacillus niameyensis]